MSDVTPFQEVEARIGLPLIDELLAERAELVKSGADLRARHGAFGTYADLRKIELSKIAFAIRAKAVLDGMKLTEAAVDERAHSDDRYIQFVMQATKERAEWAILEDRIQGIGETILRAHGVMRYVSQELSLIK